MVKLLLKIQYAPCKILNLNRNTGKDSERYVETTGALLNTFLSEKDLLRKKIGQVFIAITSLSIRSR